MVTNTTGVFGGQATELEPISYFEQLRSGLSRKYQAYFPVDEIIDFTRVNVQHVNANDLEFFETQPGSNPRWGSHDEGLNISVDRAAHAIDDVGWGYFAAVPLANIGFDTPERFLLFGTFRRPRQRRLPRIMFLDNDGRASEEPEIEQPPDPFVDGAWAVGLQIRVPGSAPDRGMGVTCQFRTDGTRLNLPRTGVMANRPFLEQTDPDLVAKIVDSDNPSNFTLILSYDRSKAPNSGYAALLVGHQVADSISFDFVNMANVTAIDYLQSGVGSITGKAYKAQVDIIDLQIWTP